MKVGLIGLGNMGSGMAANLLKRGHEVTVYNRTASKAQPLVRQGAQRAAQVGDDCRGDAVITMLSDDGAVESVVFGDAGVVKNLARGAIHVSSSTISVALTERMTAAHAASVLCRPQCLAGPTLQPRPSSLSLRLVLRMPWMPARLCSTPSASGLFVSAIERQPPGAGRG